MTSSVRAKVEKGVWRMPRLSQAMKDVISCDKPGVGARGERGELKHLSTRRKRK